MFLCYLFVSSLAASGVRVGEVLIRTDLSLTVLKTAHHKARPLGRYSTKSSRWREAMDAQFSNALGVGSTASRLLHNIQCGDSGLPIQSLDRGVPHLGLGDSVKSQSF